MATSSARVAIIVAPRERFSGSIEALDALYERTEHPFDLVYIDGNAPKSVATALADRAATHGFVLDRHERYLSPNEGRNRGIDLVRAHFPDHEYVAFLDNDAVVLQGWLAPLVNALDETGAWVVGPLTLQGTSLANRSPLAEREIHIAGGYIEFSGPPGARSITTHHRFQGDTVAAVEPELRREVCDFAEFHAMLARRSALDTIGSLDPELLNSREHLDFCLAVTEAGGTILFEPESHVWFPGAATIRTSDLRYYMRRWSDEWMTTSVARFIDKHSLDPAYMQRVEIARGRRRYALRVWAIGLTRRRRYEPIG